MAYLISAHIVRERSNFDRLSELPASIGHRVYHHRVAKVWIIDAFRASRQPEYPFQSTFSTVDVPLELPAELADLERVYSHLDDLGSSNSFKKSYINFALLLNRLLATPILSCVSDDDELDFACVVADGSLVRLKCRCGDLLITYADGKTSIQPLLPEFDDDEELSADPTELRGALPGVEVADRPMSWESRLHAIAIKEWRRFNGTETTILGLGSFDPPEDESDWQLVGSS
ncbi:MAG: hypothetical protein WD066_18455 [Planctomycetaceae bacterium]